MMNWAFWLELLVRSAALLLVGEALWRASKAQTPAFRHALILSVLGLLVLLPFLSAVLPEIRIALWHAAGPGRTLVTIHQTFARTTQLTAGQGIDWVILIWLVGAIAAFTPVLGGSVSVWRMARRANRFGDSPDVLLSDEISMPLTCGVLRPRILLPAAATQWTPARLSAVLQHELAHVRRHDVAIQMSAHFVAALWWFQPLVWLARRRLRAESELACDREAVERGLRPSAYATELLALAKSLPRDCRFASSVAISMARGRDLETRMKAILNPQLAPWSRARMGVLALGLGAAAISASAISSNQQGGSTMKRTILSALLTSVGMSAATVTGSIHDVGGAPVADAKVSIYNPDTGAKQETTTDASGKYTVKTSETGEYILRIEKPGFGPLLNALELKADTTANRNYTLASGGENATNEGQQGVRVPGEAAQNNLTTKVQPVYPITAKAAGIQGTVELEATISMEGVPLQLRVMSSPNDDLSESALEAVRQWRYRPTLLNGQPIEIVTDVMVNYTLSK